MTRSTRRLPLIALLCVTLTAAGCSFGDSEDDAKEPPASPGAVAWRDCPEVAQEVAGRSGAGMTYQCATVSVPRDWTPGDDPAATSPTGSPAASPSATAAPASTATPSPSAGAGEKVEIALVRVRSDKQADRIGSLLVNPGGPGASGIEAAVFLSLGRQYGGLPEEITNRFDVIGFDPRGVGRSTKVDCISDADYEAYFSAEPDPVTQADFNAVLGINQRVGAGCARKYGEGLEVFSTEQTARDMDAIRAAVGDQKLTYLGFSYGTLLGAVYAQLFPDKVRAFVLDGAVDPLADTIVASEGQAKGFEKAFANFATWCRATPAECAAAPDARAALTDALRAARRSPVRGADGRTATAGWIFWATVSSLYTRSGWQELASALNALAGGDPKGIFKLADRYVDREPDGTYGEMFDAFFAVNCADEAIEVTPQRARALQTQWRTKYPLFGPALATELLTCASWPGEADPYPTGPATGAPPILVVGTTGDPATPYEQTARLASMLGVGRVLTWEGEGHTAYPNTPCVIEAVNAYLIDLTVPAEGLRCPAA